MKLSTIASAWVLSAMVMGSGSANAGLTLHGPDANVAVTRVTLSSIEDAAAVPPVLIPDDVDAARAARLDDDDARLYREAFERQRAGDWTGADAAIAKIHDQRLMGHLLAQRHLHPSRKASYDELAGWLARYADHPQAEMIHNLASRRQPAGAPSPRQPRVPRTRSVGDGDLERLAGYRSEPGGLFALASLGAPPMVIPPTKPSRIEAADDSEVFAPPAVLRVTPRGRGVTRSSAEGEGDRALASVDRLLKAGDANGAWELLNTDAVATAIDRVEFDAARTRIAESFYQAGRVAEALALSSASAARSSHGSTKANWTAGLAAWRVGHYDRAARHFEAVVDARPSSPWFAAAAAYWAGRAHLRGGEPDRARVFLAAAARFPHTFYGLVAERTLGATPQLRWTLPTLTPAHLAAIAKQPTGRRAVALIQVGENALAEQELRRVNLAGDRALREAVMVLADRGGMAEFTLALGNVVEGPDGGAYDAALYPIPRWRPRDGFQIEPALIYAIIRQESRFETSLVSSAGAVGPMQIMPATARHVARQHEDLRTPDFDALTDPATNLELGQRYLVELMDMPAVGDNLFHLAAAFNAGPGNLVNWKKRFRDIKDPLLFMESLPFAETRDYLEKVLANYWIYSLRMGRGASSLDAVAAGKWPKYTPMESRPRDVSMVTSPNAKN